MQYFKSRRHAGRELGKGLTRYRDSLTVLIALSQGGVEVGEAIADELHLPLGMLATREIRLPWTGGPIVGSINSSGQFAANEALGKTMLDEFESEYHSYIEQEKIKAAHEVNMMHASNIMTYQNLKNKAVILVDDGLADIRPINEAMHFLKPVRITRLIAALPVATVGVIDKLHITVDEIHCLDVKANYISTDHYYEDKDVLDYQDVLKTLISYDTMA